MKTPLLAFIIFALVSTLPAQANELDSNTVSPNDVKVYIGEVLNVVDKNYVYPEIAKSMRKYVNDKISAGHYLNVNSQQELIEKLQSDLREASKDNHLSLHLAQGRIDRKTHILPATKTDQEFEVDFLSENADRKEIGYIRFNKFSGDEKTKERLEAAMKLLVSTDSLIIDLRENGGGSPYLAVFLSSYFLEKDTHLWSILDQKGDPIFIANSVDQDIKYKGDLCILTSEKTYSAAEAFAYTLKHLNRACIIGRATGGGAHLVQMEQVNNQIDIRISVARAYNPITKTNWEGVGVIPTINVDVSQAKAAALNYFRNKED